MVSFGPIATPIEYRPDLPEGHWIQSVDVRVFKYPKTLGIWSSGRSRVPLEFYFIEEGDPPVRVHPPSELRYYWNRVYAPPGARPIGFYLDIAEVVEVDGTIETTTGGETADSGSLINFVALPNGENVALAPGQAVFTGGEAVIDLPTDENPDYSQIYTVDGSLFWQVGARSIEQFTEGRFSFVSGSGRSMLGLVASFPVVNFQELQWAWYVHSSSLVASFERSPTEGFRSTGSYAWSPEKTLSLQMRDGVVRYGIDGQIVFESSVPVTDPVYFAAVLGPQAFVVNCLRETS